jgi:putative glutamine amidotransferase
VSRPLIGIPAQTLQSIDGIPDVLPHSWVMNSRYYIAAADMGAVPVMIPLFDQDEETLRAIFDRLDGLLLAGGVDMEPSTFGEPAHPLLGRTDPARDQVELTLARWAIAEGKPLLGLCRGHQVLNVALGGSLYQDIEDQIPEAMRHDYFPGFPRDYLAHEVSITPGTRLFAAVGASAMPVNSMHHQAVKTLGSGLTVSARAEDGVIEAIEAKGENYLVGVQWHPEVFESRDERTRRLFQSFLAAASGNAASGAGR